MLKDIFVSATSPDELKARLDEVKNSHAFRKNDRVIIVIDDTGILLCPFEFKAPGWLQWNELNKGILTEAAGMLSLENTKDVAVDFQIFDRVQDRLRGAFLCCPRNILESYINVSNKAGFLVDGLTIPALTRIDNALASGKATTQRSVYLDLSADHINLAVFNEGRCELLRVIPCDDQDEVVTEVERSLKSVCAKSQNKDCHGFHASGAVEQSRPLVEAVAKALHIEASVDAEIAGGGSAGEDAPARYFRLNLARQFVIGRRNRQKALWAMNITVIVLAAVALQEGYSLLVRHNKGKELAGSVDREQVEHARLLEKILSGKK